MKKCLKIILKFEDLDPQLCDSIQTEARNLSLEGTVQASDTDEIMIIACGTKEKIDSFLDNIHEKFGQILPEGMQVEPFLKEKDYRGIFRILE